MAVTVEGIERAGSSAPRIRDLSTAEFHARYDCDRFTATVLANRYRYIVEHMCARLLTSAFSPILRDFYDFAATLTGPPEAGYPTPDRAVAYVCVGTVCHPPTSDPAEIASLLGTGTS